MCQLFSNRRVFHLVLRTTQGNTYCTYYSVAPPVTPPPLNDPTPLPGVRVHLRYLYRATEPFFFFKRIY